MMAPLPHVCFDLGALADQLRPYCGSIEVTLPGGEFERLVKALDILRRMVADLEKELGAFRLLEAGRQGRVMVEQLATGETAGLVLDPEGKIVRPDFGRRT